MKKLKTIICIIFLFFSIYSFARKESLELRVLQLNVWHGTTAVPDGFKGLVSIIEQTDPDIVLLCEIQGANDLNVVNKLVDTLQVLGKKYYGEISGKSPGIISKYKLKTAEPCNVSLDKRPMLKSYISVEGKNLVIYSAHLDYTHYECYLPRGYSGTTWKKIDAPVLDADSVLRANRLSLRDESIRDFIEDAKTEISNGNLVLLGGDFNEPSHLDWQADTKDLRDHNGLVINWDCSVMLTQMGMVDSFREIFPNAVTHPAFTFPSANKDAPIEKLTWAPEADERDRIDFIYYYPDSAWSLSNVSVVGPEETISEGKLKEKDSADSFIVPQGVWPTDHKGTLATFRIEKNN